MRSLSLAAVFSVALAAAAAPFAPPAAAAVWEATEEWTEAHEQAFPNWVMQQWTKDYFTDQNRPLTFGLELDCADAVYAMRILYAYEHRLSFAINDPRRRGRRITNAMTRWDNYRPLLREEMDDGTWRTYRGPAFNETQKVRAFIDFVSDVTSTESLANDTYPIALTDIQPGDVFLVPGSHAYMVSQIDPTGAMTTLSASSPRAWRAFAEIRDFPAHIPTDTRRRRDGYRRFKPIDALRTRPLRIPGASAEQWEVAQSVEGDRDAFAVLTQAALARIQEPMAARVNRAFYSLCDSLRQRVEIVHAAQEHLRRMEENHNRSCMTQYEYFEYSTPTRDARLAGQFRALRALTQSPDWNESYFDLQWVVEAIFEQPGGPSEYWDMRSYCQVDIDFVTGRSMDLRQVWRALDAGLMAEDPHAPLEHRWGLAPSAWTPACPVAQPEG